MMASRIFRPLLALGALAVATASLAAEPLFIPPKEKIEEPYTNEKCLDKCHSEPELYSGSATGEKKHLFVDIKEYVFSVHGKKGVWCIDCHQGADPNVHPREGYPMADCRACHSTRGGEKFFPYDALEKLKAKGVEPPPKEALKGTVWGSTTHAWAWETGRPGAPFCADCHTAHYVRKAADPASTVNEENLAETCGRCHEPQTRSYSVGGVLARWRLGGHGKGDISERYTKDRCLSCHQGEAAHGEESVTEKGCPNCHRPAQKIDRGEKSFHLRATPEEGRLTRTLGLFYSAGIWVAALVGIAGVFVYGFITLYRNDGDE